jgi:hypothetical protein
MIIKNVGRDEGVQERHQEFSVLIIALLKAIEAAALFSSTQVNFAVRK